MPAPWRDYIRGWLLEGISHGRIAEEMKIKRVSVHFAREIYRQAGVRTLREFLAKHGRRVEATKREVVTARMVRGETNIEIAEATGLSRVAVSNHVCALYRRFGVEGSRGPRRRAARVEAVRMTVPGEGGGDRGETFRGCASGILMWGGCACRFQARAN